MQLGMLLRNSSPVATTAFIAACARAGDNSGLDHLWVLDHIAIPPDDAEGSEGRYVDALATLAFVAGITQRVGIGTSVLVAPYRPPLATANWLASIQELSGGRLQVGIGAGWMPTEFAAAGVPLKERGTVTDDTLAYIHKCFANDIVSEDDYRFIFSPRPARPPLLIGGNGARARRRTVEYGDGWMPTEGDAGKLREPIGQLREAFAAAGKDTPVVIPLTRLALDDTGQAAAALVALAEAGCTGVEHAARYDSVTEFEEIAGQLCEARDAAGLG